MYNDDITKGLLQLGFNTGWVADSDKIILWENSEPQPNEKDILDAAKLWDKTCQAEAEAKAQAKAAAEGKLAALGLTTDDLRALGL